MSGTRALRRKRRGFYPFPSSRLPRAAAQREQRGAAGLRLLPGRGELPAQGKAEHFLPPPPTWMAKHLLISLLQGRAQAKEGSRQGVVLGTEVQGESRPGH